MLSFSALPRYWVRTVFVPQKIFRETLSYRMMTEVSISVVLADMLRDELSHDGVVVHAGI